MEKVTKIYAPLESGCKDGYVTTANQIKGLEDFISNTATGIIDIEYLSLRKLCDDGELVPGRRYRIIDYVTVINERQLKSAGHPFAVIVTAETTSRLRAEAKASVLDGDTYFANSDLDSWVLKYDISNNRDKYFFADEESGKGVIYYMKDEFDNEAHFDFKNVTWDELYTFETSTQGDGSMNGECICNKIGAYYSSSGRLFLNSIVVRGNNNNIEPGCSGIIVVGNNNKILKSYNINLVGDCNIVNECQHINVSGGIYKLYNSIFRGCSNLYLNILSDSYNVVCSGVYSSTQFVDIITDPTLITYISPNTKGEAAVRTTGNIGVPTEAGFAFRGDIESDNDLSHVIYNIPANRVYFRLLPNISFPSLSNIENLRYVTGGRGDFATLHQKASLNNKYDSFSKTVYLIYDIDAWYILDCYEEALPSYVGEDGTTMRGLTGRQRMSFLSPHLQYKDFDTLISSNDFLIEDTSSSSEFGDCHYGKVSLGLGHSDNNVLTGLNLIMHKGGRRNSYGEIRHVFPNREGYYGVSLRLGMESFNLQSFITNSDGSEEVQNARLSGVEDPSEETDAVNKRYCDAKFNEKSIVLTYDCEGEFTLTANKRLRFCAAIEGDLQFTLDDEARLMSDQWHIFGDDFVKPFEVEFFVNPDLSTSPEVTFISNNYNTNIYWEKPFEAKPGCYYRITIDYNIAKFVEIENYELIRPR